MNSSNSKPLNLFIIRHGETEWNLERRLQGQKNSNLTERGKVQASKVGDTLGKQLEDLDISCHSEILFVSSDLGRAKETMELIKSAINDHCKSKLTSKVHFTADFREWYMGDLEGRTIKDLNETDPGLLDLRNQYREGDLSVQQKTKHNLGETLEEHLNRTEKGLKFVLETLEEKHKAVVLVSHGGTITHALKEHILPAKHPNFKVPNSSISQFEVVKDINCSKFGHKFQKIKLCCTEHLGNTGFI